MLVILVAGRTSAGLQVPVGGSCTGSDGSSARMPVAPNSRGRDLIPMCCGYSEVLNLNSTALLLKLTLVSDKGVIGARQLTFEHLPT
jgi:hypothetical protein